MHVNHLVHHVANNGFSEIRSGSCHGLSQFMLKQMGFQTFEYSYAHDDHVGTSKTCYVQA